jgi:hypothetical protein
VVQVSKVCDALAGFLRKHGFTGVDADPSRLASLAYPLSDQPEADPSDEQSLVHWLS